MSVTNVLDSPIILESINRTSDELLRRSKSKDYQSIPDTMLLSESALSDWDNEEEDVAWASL
jgi:hypothetical protein